MSAASSAAAAIAALPDVQAFETGAFDPARFDHEGHVHVAWCYLRTYPLPEAIARFTTALRALTIKLDIPRKYHETISWFFMIEIADRQATNPEDTWDTFKRKNSDLFEDASTLLHRHYSPERLASDIARSRFVLPDRAPVA